MTNSRIAAGIAVALVVAYCNAVCRADVHFTVGTPEQGGQFATVQAAVDAVPAANTERHIIDIMPGTYMARVKIPADKPFITLRGEDPLTTKLTFNEPFDAAPNENTNHATVVVQGKDFIAQNLTLENAFTDTSPTHQIKQALALYAKADRMIFNNCRFLGYQDTLRSEVGRHYFYSSYVEGTVDFIYGKGTAYFENSIIFPKSNGQLTAQGREGAADKSGFVFKNATITGSANNNTVYLGRPWAPYAQVVFIDSKMGPAIRAAGWTQGDQLSYFAEFNSMDLTGNPLNVSQRVNYSHQLTAAEAEAYSKANWLGGSDGWNPVIDPLATFLPGDFNNDGIVDAADYTVWRNHVGDPNESAIHNNGDGGGVAMSDYDFWRARYGNSNLPEGGGGTAGFSGSQNVPEPATIFLAMICVPALAWRSVAGLCRSND